MLAGHLGARSSKGSIQCADCARVYPRALSECPRCGSEETVAAKSSGKKTASKYRVRRGILWMLVAGAIYLLASQGSVSFPPAVTDYLLPLLFLGGLGLTVFGLIGWLR
jgi:hypothetical protein